jgi:N-dimethylarginine dimethylaminohydrolase
MMINKRVLMSGADYFDVVELNSYSKGVDSVNHALVNTEFKSIQDALKSAGIEIISCSAPPNCQDGIFTANWGLCKGNKVVLSSLPGPRKAEETYAVKILIGLGKEVIKAPYKFSGQGDALPCGNYLFCGSNYRTDPRMHDFLAETFDSEIISLQTIPEIDSKGMPVINSLSGWPDSFFYDIDLAISILRDDLIAWCPEAFDQDSQDKMRELPIEKIEVSLEEAMEGFACNLISTGEMVIMSAHAPKLKSKIEARGLKTITPNIKELAKGGGYIRCTTLTLD